MFEVKPAVCSERWANLQLHRKAVQSSTTPIARHSTWRDRLSLCPMLNFNLLEQAIYCTLADHAAVLTFLTCRLQLEDDVLGVKAQPISVRHSREPKKWVEVTLLKRSHYDHYVNVCMYIYIYYIILYYIILYYIVLYYIILYYIIYIYIIIIY